MHDPFYRDLATSRSALFLDGWLKFNEGKWGYKPERVVFQIPGKELPRLEGVFYLNKRGQVVMPPRNPYLPLQFTPTQTEQPYRLYTQWLEVSELFADDLLKRGFEGAIAFPPGFIDGRIFQWRDSNVGIRYTFVSTLPIVSTEIDPSTRNKIRKAEKKDYTVKRSTDWVHIHKCLELTEEEKNFSHLTPCEDLSFLQELLGSEHFRGYLCLSSDGEPVSGQIKLFLAEGISIDWSAGTDRNHIRNGVNQLTYQKSFEDMAENGGRLFDLCGANIRAVANAKATWGFPLIPYLTLTNDPIPRKVFRTLVPKKIRTKLRPFLRGL